MRTPYFRTALASSVMALVIAFYPATAIVNADTSTETTTAPQPTTTAQTAETPAPSAPEAATSTSASATPTQSTTADTSSTDPTPTEASVAPAQPPASANTSTPTDPSETSASQPSSPDSGTAPQNATNTSSNPSTVAQDSTATSQPTPAPGTPSTPSNASNTSNPSTISSATPANTLANTQDATINGTISSTSKSGDASATQNTTVDNVTSGNALAVTNLFNLVQSSANFLDPDNQLKTFTANIQGDVVGDLLLDPGQINSLTASSGTTPMGSLTVNNQTNAAINAKVNLDAQSGDATTASNTKVGDTTTGNADAIANVVNMINSTIGAGQSFMGAINIYGNLDGDILLPPGFLDTLLASNNQSQAPTSPTPNTSTLVNQTNNQAINNAITANAQSGTATVTDNTKAGNTTTGNALTNLTVLNLSSSDVIGANNLLVFVNVLGKWYGVIMDAPAGTTAASLGGGITQNKSLTQAQDTTTRSTTNSVINNDINVRARSGDALVTKNTTAGNATTGNATASVNLANFIGNHLSLSDWFGILFINVFGTWNGSFGIDTVAGGITGPSNPTPAGNQTTGPPPAQARVFKFVPNGTAQNAKTSAGNAPYHLEPVFLGDLEMNQNGQPATENDVPTVLTSTIVTKGEPKTIFKPTPSENKKQMASWILPVAGLTLGSLLLIGERVVARRQEQ